VFACHRSVFDPLRFCVAWFCILVASPSRANTVSYTIDSQSSSIALSAIVTFFGFDTVPQKAGSDTTEVAGTLVADLNGNTLTFSGTSNVVALGSPLAPFAPPSTINPTIDNIGLKNDPTELAEGSIQAAVRDATATFSTGAASFNGPVSGLEIEFSAGRIDYKFQGTVNTLELKDLDPDFNESTGSLTRTVHDGVETISIPVSYSALFQAIFPDDSTLFVDGTIVASRSLSTPFSRGDFNGDGRVDGADIPAMLTALTNLAQFKANNGLTDDQLRTLGDIDSDGKITNADVQAFLTLLSSGAAMQFVPEPASWILASLALAAGGCRRPKRVVFETMEF
jgi:hypothetical protein